MTCVETLLELVLDHWGDAVHSFRLALVGRGRYEGSTELCIRRGVLFLDSFWSLLKQQQKYMFTTLNTNLVRLYSR